MKPLTLTHDTSTHNVCTKNKCRLNTYCRNQQVSLKILGSIPKIMPSSSSSTCRLRRRGGQSDGLPGASGDAAHRPPGRCQTKTAKTIMLASVVVLMVWLGAFKRPSLEASGTSQLPHKRVVVSGGHCVGAFTADEGGVWWRYTRTCGLCNSCTVRQDVCKCPTCRVYVCVCVCVRVWEASVRIFPLLFCAPACVSHSLCVWWPCVYGRFCVRVCFVLGLLTPRWAAQGGGNGVRDGFTVMGHGGKLDRNPPANPSDVLQEKAPAPALQPAAQAMGVVEAGQEVRCFRRLRQRRPPGVRVLSDVMRSGVGSYSRWRPAVNVASGPRGHVC